MLTTLFQIELERLNTATDDINKLEVDLDVSNFSLTTSDLAFIRAWAAV